MTAEQASAAADGAIRMRPRPAGLVRRAVERALVGARPASRAAVVVPIYRARANRVEAVSAARLWQVLGRRPFVFVAPEGLDLPGDIVRDARVVRFAADRFRSVQSYSRLLLSPAFYERLSEFEFVLLHQLDAFVFRDELDEWCDRGYDYVGAPWPGGGHTQWVATQASKVRSLFARLGVRTSRRVGNGGFSLRRVPAARAALRLLKSAAERFPMNEDVFWSFHVTSYLPWFRVPCADEAAAFAIETSPADAIARADGRLPFGCHAWHLHEPHTWSPILRRFGYEVPIEAGHL